jgi:hypothetical protein
MASLRGPNSPQNFASASLVIGPSNLAAVRRPWLIVEIDISERLAAAIAQDKAGLLFQLKQAGRAQIKLPDRRPRRPAPGLAKRAGQRPREARFFVRAQKACHGEPAAMRDQD